MSVTVTSRSAGGKVEQRRGWHARGERAHGRRERECSFAELNGRHGGRKVVLVVSAVELLYPRASQRSHGHTPDPLRAATRVALISAPMPKAQPKVVPSKE